MNREKAIEILKQFKRCLADVVFDEKGSEAWQMAIKALSQEPCGDVVSRQAVINAIENDCMKGGLGSCFACYNDAQAFRGEIEKLPSVTQKSGKWIDRQFQSKIDGEIRNGWECSECGERFFRYDLVNTDEFIPKYCPNCGAKMIEPQESEE